MVGPGVRSCVPLDGGSDQMSDHESQRVSDHSSDHMQFRRRTCQPGMDQVLDHVLEGVGGLDRISNEG